MSQRFFQRQHLARLTRPGRCQEGSGLKRKKAKKCK